MPATVNYAWNTKVAPFFVNDVYTIGNQTLPAIATLSNGSYFATWDGPSNEYVEGRIFKADGTALGSEFLVNNVTTNDQTDSSVSGLADGKAIVAFTDYSADPGGDIRARIFNADGTPVANDFVIISGTGKDSRADVAGLADGGYVVTWSRDYTTDFDIRTQVFNADGTPRSSVLVTENTAALDAKDSSVAALKGGGFVVGWQQATLPGGNPAAVFQLYSATGATVGTRVTVDNIGINTDVQVAGLPDGGFAIAYTDTGWAYSGTEITLKLYNADGTAKAPGWILVNTNTNGNQNHPSLSVLSNGYLVVGWDSGNSSYVQAYDPATGATIGSNQLAASSVVESEVSGLPGGLLANVNSSLVADSGGGYSIRSSILELSRTITGTADNEILAGDALRDNIDGGAGGDFIIGFGGNNTLNGGTGFDSVSWYSEASGITVNLTDQDLNAGAATGDTVANFEAYYLTNFDDDFTGDNSGAFVYGFGGNDTIKGGNFSDFIDGGDGADHIDAGDGFDYVSWNTSPVGLTINLNNSAVNTGMAAGDVVENAEAFYLSEFDDTFTGQNTGQNIVFGQAGNDRLYGGTASNDWLFGGDGNDVLVGGTLNDLLAGGAGADTFYFGNYKTMGLDQILDFVSGQDRINISAAGFGLSPGVTIGAGVDFIASNAPLADTAEKTFLYNTANGFISYDDDGTGPHLPIALIQLAGHPALAASDIHVV